MEKLNLYLDNNATSAYSPSVLEYIKNEFSNEFYNASSEHDAGYSLSLKIKEYRKLIADFLGVSTKKIIFNSGATESINTILSIENLKNLNISTIISSPMEHHATLHQLDFLKNNGFNVVYIKNNNQGELDLNDLEEKAKEHAHSLVSLLFVNNETGVINDVKKIVEISHKNNCKVHIDAVQALGKIQFDLEDINCDFASFSGHKIGSFKGIGLMYVNDIDSFKPLLHGGSQERGYRPGTYNYPAIKSLALAVKDIDFSNVEKKYELRNEFEEKLLTINSNFSINCRAANRVSNTISLCVGDLDARSLLLKLSQVGIYVSTGSACTGSNQEPSHVISAIRNSDHIDTLRISANFKDEIIEKFVLCLKEIIE